ncbi:MAG: hypothetical protein HY543_02100 [Deltaproteobacteria bacterium]|nr:hypothetical protein [Deltaproteobacteria bacterium]
MLLIRWLQHVLFGQTLTALLQGKVPARRTQTTETEPPLLDVVREALREEADELSDLVARGIPPMRRRRLKQRARRRVQQAIAKEFDSPEIVDEVTERLVHAAEIDPYYARLVEDDDTK